MITALTNELAVFGRRIDAAESPREKINLIFQAMLTQRPTPEEMEIALAEVERFGDTGYDNLVWALMNTQRFLFIE